MPASNPMTSDQVSFALVVYAVLHITIYLLIERNIRRRRQRIEKAITEAIMAERERCAKVAESLMELLSVSIDPHTSAACAARFAGDAVIKIRSGK